MLKLGMEIADVFPVLRAHAADGIDVEVAVAAVRGVDAEARAAVFIGVSVAMWLEG